MTSNPKSKLYKLNNPDAEATYFYARNPIQIIQTILEFQKTLTEEDKQNPNLMSWIKNRPTMNDISEAEEGVLTY
jgi:hypothetical protein